MKAILTFSAAIAILIVGGSVAALAQPAGNVHRIGFVSSVPRPFDTFRRELNLAGYVEGQNIIIERRSWDGRAERAPELVAELLRLRVDVLVVGSVAGALAAKRATTTVPVVFASVNDPVAAGIVPNLARPGGNITGATMLIGGSGLGGKWVELLKNAAPGVSHVAVLWNSANPANAPFLREMRVAAQTLKVKLDALDAGNASNLNNAFAAIGASGAHAIVVTPDPFFYVSRARLVQFAATSRLPAIYYAKDYADAGGLMSYGVAPDDSWRKAARYVDKILKGTKPADLPVEQPTKFEFVINLKAARALGLSINSSLLARADRVIE